MAKKVIIAASELHRAAGKALKRVALQDEHLVVERDGYPIAVLMSYQEYEDLMRLRALAAHRELPRALSQEAAKQGLTEEQLLVELEEDKRAVVFVKRKGDHLLAEKGTTLAFQPKL